VNDIPKGNTNDEIKFYMDNNKEKGKNREDSLELRIFYFYLSLRNSIQTRGIHWVSW
jgi:hypothetical protein